MSPDKRPNRAWAVMKESVVDARTVAPSQIGAMVNALVVLEGFSIVSGVAGDTHIERLWRGRRDHQLELVEIHLVVLGRRRDEDRPAALPGDGPGLRRALVELRAARDESCRYDYRWEICLEACSRVAGLIAEAAAAEVGADP